MVRARRQAASSRSVPELFPSRMMPKHDRKPCWGWGREARMVSTTRAVAAPLSAAHRISRWGGHAT